MADAELERWWRMSETDRCVDVIRVGKVWRLGNFDGCICSRFSVRNVDIEIACGKGGERGVNISSPSLDYWDWKKRSPDTEALRPIAEEVVRQLNESGDHRGPLPITYGNELASVDTHAKR